MKTSPLAANMGWTVAWQPEDRQFIGRAALERQRMKGTEQLVGLIMTEKACYVMNCRCIFLMPQAISMLG